MKIVIQQWAEEPSLHSYRVVAEAVSEVEASGALKALVSVHVDWADTFREATESATHAAHAFGCGVLFVSRLGGQR